MFSFGFITQLLFPEAPQRVKSEPELAEVVQKTFIERLTDASYDLSKVPSFFDCAIAFVTMNNPVMVDSNLSHALDQKTIDSLAKVGGAPKHPFFRGQFITVIPLDLKTLEDEIAKINSQNLTIAEEREKRLEKEITCTVLLKDLDSDPAQRKYKEKAISQLQREIHEITEYLRKQGEEHLLRLEGQVTLMTQQDNFASACEAIDKWQKEIIKVKETAIVAPPLGNRYPDPAALQVYLRLRVTQLEQEKNRNLIALRNNLIAAIRGFIQVTTDIIDLKPENNEDDKQLRNKEKASIFEPQEKSILEAEQEIRDLNAILVEQEKTCERLKHCLQSFEDLMNLQARYKRDEDDSPVIESYHFEDTPVLDVCEKLMLEVKFAEVRKTSSLISRKQNFIQIVLDLLNEVDSVLDPNQKKEHPDVCGKLHDLVKESKQNIKVLANRKEKQLQVCAQRKASIERLKVVFSNHPDLKNIFEDVINNFRTLLAEKFTDKNYLEPYLQNKLINLMENILHYVESSSEENTEQALIDFIKFQLRGLQGAQEAQAPFIGRLKEARAGIRKIEKTLHDLESNLKQKNIEDKASLFRLLKEAGIPEDQIVKIVDEQSHDIENQNHDEVVRLKLSLATALEDYLRLVEKINFFDLDQNNLVPQREFYLLEQIYEDLKYLSQENQQVALGLARLINPDFFRSQLSILGMFLPLHRNFSHPEEPLPASSKPAPKQEKPVIKLPVSFSPMLFPIDSRTATLSVQFYGETPDGDLIRKPFRGKI